MSTDRSVTLAGVSWAFSCAPSDASIARVLVDHLLTSAANGTDRFALLTTTDHESRMTARAVLRECSRRGRLPAFRFEAQPGTHAIDRQIAATVDARPDVVLIIASSEDSARLTIAVREKLPGVKLFGGQAMGRTGFPELAGKAAEGARFPLLVVDSQADSARAQQFRASFLAECGRPPDYMAALTYDSTRLMLEAIRASGPSRARLRETLSRMSPWQGIAGSIHFDGTGQNTRSDISMAEIKSGVVVPLTGPCALHATASNQP